MDVLTLDNVLNPVPTITSSMYDLHTRTEMNTTVPSTLPQDEEAGANNTHLIMFILWGIVLPLVAGVGLIGNILTMVVLWRKEMHSTTILYLRALVVTDTGILIGAVITLTPISCAHYLGGETLDYFKDQVYPILHTPGYYLVMTLQQCNVWITVSVAMERYIAICHPFRAARLITRKKTIIVIIAIATISMLYNIPHLLATKAVDCKEDSQNSTDVSLDSKSASINTNSSNGSVFSISSVTPKSQFDILSSPVYVMNVDYKPCLKVSVTAFGSSVFYITFRTILYAAIIHVIPFLGLVILNSFLIRELMVMQRRRTGTNINDENEANLSLVLVLIVIVFILCQTPGLISQFEIQPTSAFHTWLAVANLMFATNSAVNFLIYTAFGRKFRKVLLRIFRHIYKGRRKSANCSYRTWQYSNNECEMSTVGKSDIVRNEKFSNGHKIENRLLYKTKQSTRKQSACEKPLNGMTNVNEV